MSDDHFDHQAVDNKWQKRWQAEKRYRTPVPTKNKTYVLDMFPYPSGEGLHVGHPLGYIGSDIVARYFRACGKEVLHPMGFDAFGLPAEDYAIKTGTHPAVTTERAIKRYREQLDMIGLSYDWDRMVVTSRPDYYRWTQWLFLKLFEKGLAYRAKAPVNWCSHCQTVLANEQVITKRITRNDKQSEAQTQNVCERCETQVEQRDLEQWFFKITDYADELLKDVDKLDWPEPIKIMQRNWIGKSEGAIIEFQIKNSKFTIQVFTTRPETLFGATYLVLAPEHEFVKNLIKDKDPQFTNRNEVETYLASVRKKTELERKAEDKDKTGIELKGLTAINPATKEEIPIWVADYVLASYGTGAIMAVPAHDERDFAFAKRHNLPIKTVILPKTDQDLIYWDQLASWPQSKNRVAAIKRYIEEIKAGQRCYTGQGIVTNSGDFSGLPSEVAKLRITEAVGGKLTTTYRLRDWLVSRQRYWGAPIPIIYCRNCLKDNSKFKTATIDDVTYVIHPVPESQLPVLLPNDVDFKPTGQSPLVDSKSFHSGVVCPKCGQPARREVDTLDTFVDSSWYFLRYADPHNDKAAFDSDKVAAWLPVDYYVGGAEHAVLHLLYARFITKALADLGFLNFREPFLRLRNQGLIGGEDGRKMSKRWGNVVNPDDVVRDYGADALRAFEMFMGPFEEAKPWSTHGIVGVRRWLERVWKLQHRVTNHEVEIKPETPKVLHQTIQKVTQDIVNFHFNTAVSQLMICTNVLEKETKIPQTIWQTFLELLCPITPHLAYELWERAGFKGYPDDNWPTLDVEKIKPATVTLAIQVNGKLRGQIEVESDASETKIIQVAQAVDSVKTHLVGKTIRKTIVIPGRIVNFVVE